MLRGGIIRSNFGLALLKTTLKELKTILQCGNRINSLQRCLKKDIEHQFGRAVIGLAKQREV